MGRPRVLPDPLPRLCAHCACEFTPKQPKHWRQKFCSQQCGGKANCAAGLAAASTPDSRARMADAKRGTGTGYIKRGGRHEHRVVMEAHIGRPLRRDEVVHHRDGNKKNNSLDNLELMSQGDHCRAHDFGHHPHANRRGRR